MMSHQSITNIATLLVINIFIASGEETRLKRMVHGVPLASHEDYNTYHFIHLRNQWACTHESSQHVASNDCLENEKCGGTLIQPNFVITACHCTQIIEFHEVPINEFEDVNPANGGVVNRRLVHRLYSNWGLFAGSTHYWSMTQKRHVERIYQHQACHEAGEEDGSSREYHDVALMIPCQPFEINADVRLAPMKPIREWKKQYDDIVRKSAVCLYVGFGNTDDPDDEVPHPNDDARLVETEWLRYVWRPTDCQTKCGHHPTWNDTVCTMCSTNLGGSPSTSGPSGGDSGSPVACNGWFVGVMYFREDFLRKNFTRIESYPIQCLRQYLDHGHLDYLATLSAGRLHFIDP